MSQPYEVTCSFNRGNIERTNCSKIVFVVCVCMFCFMFVYGLVLWTDLKKGLYIGVSING